MAIQTQDRIKRWLGEAFTCTSEPPATAALHHAPVDQSQRAVQSWRLQEISDAKEVEELAAKIEERISSDAEALGGMQRYVLRAWSRDGHEIGSLTLRRTGTLDSGAIDSEPANANGVIAMLQRHAEGSTRILLEGVASVLSSQREQIQAQAELISRFHQQQAEAFELQRKLMTSEMELQILADSERAARDRDAMKEAAEQERKNKAIEMAVTALSNVVMPAIAHKLTGGKSGKSELESSLDEARRLFAGKSPEAVAALFDAAGEARPLFMAMYERFKPVLEEEARATAAPLNGALAAFGRALVGVIQTRQAGMVELMGPLSRGTAFSDLPQVQRSGLHDVVRESWRKAGPPFEGEAPPALAEAIWEELHTLEPEAMLGVAKAFTVGASWEQLDAAAKDLVAAIVYRALASAGIVPASEPAEPARAAS